MKNTLNIFNKRIIYKFFYIYVISVNIIYCYLIEYFSIRRPMILFSLQCVGKRPMCPTTITTICWWPSWWKRQLSRQPIRTPTAINRRTSATIVVSAVVAVPIVVTAIIIAVATIAAVIRPPSVTRFHQWTAAATTPLQLIRTIRIAR